MTSRTLGAISTRPSSDAGPYYFISIQSGRRINWRNWASLPIPEAVVSQVHLLTRRAKANKLLTFTNTVNEDPETLYVNFEPDEDNADLKKQDVQPAGVDNNDDDDNPQEDRDYDLGDDSDDGTSYDDNDDKGNEIKGKNRGDETPGVSEETPGVDDVNARCWISMPLAEGLGTDPNTGLVPTNMHPPCTRTGTVEEYLAGLSSERRLEIIVGNMPPAFIHIVLCGGPDWFQRPTIFLYPNLRCRCTRYTEAVVA